jgi:hypothetical protein
MFRLQDKQLALVLPPHVRVDGTAPGPARGASADAAIVEAE